MDGDTTDIDNLAEVQQLISSLMMDPDREPVASEIMVLQSIYGDNSVHLWKQPGGTRVNNLTIRYVVSLDLPSHENVSVRVLVSMSSSYPASTAPQLQLLSRYIGAFGIDASLFGSILKTFISVSGVQWLPGTVCVFDGLQNVLEMCERWYEERLAVDKPEVTAADEPTPIHLATCEPVEEVASCVPPPLDGLQLVEAEAIVDRKSIFVGRACRISHPSQVPLILDRLVSDKHVARAAHPIINAWRCKVGNVLHQDNDDNGETAAGSRLAHLLSILEVDDVLVVVTRWFGGIHLGPDRFKHINHAARNALEAAGFLDQPEDTKKGGKGPSKGRKR